MSAAPAVTRAAIVAEARTWVGTPWVHQHREKGIAVDCVGLVIGVAKALGLLAPDFDVTGYGRAPDGTLLARCAEHLRPLGRDEMRPGDVLVLATSQEPQHMGIVGDYRHGGLSLIHAASHQRRVIEHRLLFVRCMQFRAGFAFPGVVD